MPHMINISVPPRITAAITAAQVPAAPVAQIILDRATERAILHAIATHQSHQTLVKRLKPTAMQQPKPGKMPPRYE